MAEINLRNRKRKGQVPAMPCTSQNILALGLFFITMKSPVPYYWLADSGSVVERQVFFKNAKKVEQKSIQGLTEHFKHTPMFRVVQNLAILGKELEEFWRHVSTDAPQWCSIFPS